jgi:hypothetical protein
MGKEEAANAQKATFSALSPKKFGPADYAKRLARIKNYFSLPPNELKFES